MAGFTIPTIKSVFIDPQTKLVSRDWYIYLLNLLKVVGTGNVGTTTQVLHGGGAGFSQVNLQQDVVSVLPGANGGTGVANIAETITLGGNLATGGEVNFSTVSTTIFRTTAATDVAIPPSGTLLVAVTLAGAVTGTTSGSTVTAILAPISLIGDVTGTISGTTVTTTIAIGGQLPATLTNDSASQGKLGEYQISTVTSGAAVSLASAVVKQITNVSLTAGDWDVTGQVNFTGVSTTVIQYMQQGTSAVSTALPALDGYSSILLGATFLAADPGNSIPVSRMSLVTTTSVYLVTKAGFTVSTLTAFGSIRARRAR